MIEKLPKCVNEKMINGVRDSELRHRIYQAASRGMVKTIKEVAEKHCVPTRKVDPRHTFQSCPVCGYRPATRHAGRVMACLRCGFSHVRDVVAYMDLLKRLVNEGHVPLEV